MWQIARKIAIIAGVIVAIPLTIMVCSTIVFNVVEVVQYRRRK